MGDAETCLAWFRYHEDLVDAVVVASDENAMKVLIAWRSVAPPWRPPSGEPPEDRNERWTWLWLGRAPHNVPWLRKLAEASGVPVAHVLRCWRVLWMQRLVYPDGTVSEEALKVVRAFLAQQIARRSPQRRR